MPQLAKNIDFSKYKRFFAFGCSFTEWQWMTWADIIGMQFGDQYYNWGKMGGGNLFIACSIAEANARYKFNNTDLVICMWSSFSREDRYKDKQWITHGNVYSSPICSKEFLAQWTDSRYYLLRDLAQISLVHNLFSSLKCDWDFLSMIDIYHYETFDNQKLLEKDILSVYRGAIKVIKPSVFKTIYNSMWENPQGIDNDIHPTPLQHKAYLDVTYPETDFTFSTSLLTKEEDEWRKGLYSYKTKSVIRPKFNRL